MSCAWHVHGMCMLACACACAWHVRSSPLILVARLHELKVEALCILEQFVVRPLLDHLTSVDDGDGVGAADGREAVRDGEGGALHLGHHLIERCLHDLLARVVERAGRLVEQHDAGLLNDGTRDGDALLLPARELAAAQTHLRLVAVAEGLGDETWLGLGWG